MNDLYKDLCDGRMLLQLLHILSGEDLGQVSRGRLRINQLENVDKALKFLKEKNVSFYKMVHWYYIASCILGMCAYAG